MTRYLAQGNEPFWMRVTDLQPAVDGGQNLDGNVQKAVLVDQAGVRYFIKRYHHILQVRDAVYEFIGQRVAVRVGLPTAATFLAEESGLYLCSRDFLQNNERVVTLRAMRFEAKDPLSIIDFYEREFGNGVYAMQIFLLDAVLNNRGRHTGNWAIVTDAEGKPLAPCPVFDTVAFDNTRLWEAAKNKKRRWLSRGGSHEHSHIELAKLLKRSPYLEQCLPLVMATHLATLDVLHECFSTGLLEGLEFEFMLSVLDASMGDLGAELGLSF